MASVAARPCSAKLSSKSFNGLSLKTSARPVAMAAKRATMPVRMEAATLEKVTVDGKASGSATLDVKTAGASASGLVHKYIVMHQQNARRGTASTLTRSEVRGGGKKPMAQKGTGNARLGSRRTPLKPGGGVLFGPKPKDWTISMNKKERRLAMSSALQNAAGSMVVVEDLAGTFADMKTKKMAAALVAWGVKPRAHAVLCLSTVPEDVKLAGRNIEGLKICTLDNLSIFDVLKADKLVFDQATIDKMNETYSSGSEDSA
mmetsp:Transcript_11468/g.19592  ORF Transcript_11468/g.19592 Transcript_11468/m.19592 type:complete len:260 (-) Transcript_11468:117-896(-)|eukprot:CAMPEP_0198232242 /NCGR_PEP_ID=MMETSP1445-20131203/115627_1 /TAXON_ID=36898 /ORGANISM="Pyramimonas sp., Strain CCMP2087" /LENGTH=259 /DNA_ID=CAMNT_0043912903 /DNA_START=753 /DNA_END=1532 /DNA_ORIENTATION=-